MSCRNCPSCLNRGCISCIERVYIFSSLTPEELHEITRTITKENMRRVKTYIEGHKAEKLFIPRGKG